MLLTLLAIILILTLLVSYFANEWDIVSPSVLFVAGFALSAVWAVGASGFWGYEMQPPAFLVIAGGALIFFLVATGVHLLIKKRRTEHGYATRYLKETRDIRTEPLLKFNAPMVTVYIVVQAATVLWTLVCIKNAYPGASLSTAIANYKYAITFTTNAPEFPFLLRQLRALCLSASFIILFLTAQELASRRWRSAGLCGFAFALYLLQEVEIGGRTGCIMTLFSLLICYFVLLKRMGVKREKSTRKLLLILLGAGCLMIALFPIAAIGRDISEFGTAEYLSIYIAAEIPNLDLYLLNYTGATPDIWGAMTFYNSIDFLGRNLGIGQFVYVLDLPFGEINGHSLGNVYSTFYAFIHDFGYIGVPVLTAVMAAVSQLVYEKVTAFKTRFAEDIWIAIYANIGVQLLFCFFSNKFFEDVFTIAFIKVIVITLILRYLYKAGSRMCSRLAIGGTQEMKQMSKQIKKTIRIGAIVAVVCAAVFGVVGFFSVQAPASSFVASKTLNIVASAGANDSQVTKNSLSATTANDIADYMKTEELRVAAVKGAGIDDESASSYKVGVAHTGSTRVITVQVTGPNRDQAEKMLNKLVNLSESAGKKTFNLGQIEEVTSLTKEDNATSSGASPKKTAVLFAAAGFVIGILLVVVWYSLSPRLRSEGDACETTGLPVVGRINLGKM